MRKTGVSVCSLEKKGEQFEINEKYFKMCQDANIEAMEVTLPFGYDFFKLDFKYLQKLANKYNVELWSYHVPFSGYFDPSSLDEEKAKNAMEDFKLLMKNASVSDVKYIVIHPSEEITTTERRDERMENAKRRLSELAEYANTLGLTIAVETLPRLCLGNSTDEMEELMKANDKLRICFDVNHIELGTQKEFLERLGDKIVTLHISDYNIPDNHLLPFEGKIDWKEFIIALDKANYNGVFMYEAGLMTKDGTDIMRNAKIYYDLHKKIEELK